MLVLTRQLDEGIFIGEDVFITVLEIRGSQVRLGLTAPTDVSILRDELVQTVDQVDQDSCATNCL